MYAITSHQKQEGSLDVITFMIKLFIFDVYVSLDLRATLSFVTTYIAMRFEHELYIIGSSIENQHRNEFRQLKILINYVCQHK